MSIEKRQRDRRRERHQAYRDEWEAGLPERRDARQQLRRAFNNDDLGGTVKALGKVIWLALK